MLLWHYTTGERFTEIVQDGVLLPAVAGVPRGERPAVWFSANQDWEPTACKAGKSPTGKLVPLTREETYHRGAGLVRFGVERAKAPFGWTAFQRISGISRKNAQHLEQKGRRQGATPTQWFVSFEPVQRADWAAVEVWDSGKWVPVPNMPATAETAEAA